MTTATQTEVIVHTTTGFINIPRQHMLPNRKVHLRTIRRAEATRCGLPLTGRHPVFITEHGVNYATCRSCILSYDSGAL